MPRWSFIHSVEPAGDWWVADAAYEADAREIAGDLATLKAVLEEVRLGPDS